MQKAALGLASGVGGTDRLTPHADGQQPPPLNVALPPVAMRSGMTVGCSSVQLGKMSGLTVDPESSEGPTCHPLESDRNMTKELERPGCVGDHLQTVKAGRQRQGLTYPQCGV